MAEVMLYARADGLYEPRHPKAVEICKANAGKGVLADIRADFRSSLQNRYLNGWIYTNQICGRLNDAGILNPVGAIWTRNIIHAVMQENFLVVFEFLQKGKHIKVYESTADMSRKRMCEYINDQIKPFVSSMWEIEIDDPKSGFYEELYREFMK